MKIKKILILLFLISVFPIIVFAGNTYYVATDGGDAGHSGASDDEWLTLQYAFSQMSSGDTLIIRDGTYTGVANTITNSAYPPSGSSEDWTEIQAENKGAVIIDGQDTVQPIYISLGESTDVYWSFDGIIFENSVGQNVYMSFLNYVKMTNCGFLNSAATSDSFSNHTCSYFLLEDCYSWGNARYNFHYYNTTNSIFRRCVVRHDIGSYEMQVGFQIYASEHIYIQNCIVIDSDTGIYSSPDEFYGFKIPQVSSGNIFFDGCIALNNPDMTAYYSQAGNSTIENSVAWGETKGVRSRSSDTTTWNHMTIGAITSYGTDGDGTTKIMNNSIVYNCTTYGIFDWGGDFTSDYNSLYANGSDFNGVTNGINDLCAANSNAIDPIDGTPGNGTTALKYLTRIEDSSDLDGVASDSGDIGATILKQFGTSGTLWGEEGYNTITETDLWPFPNEDLIKTKMAAYTYDDGGGGDPEITGARGFCATGKQLNGTDDITLTSYIWEYLGNEIPGGIDTPDTTAPTPDPSTFASAPSAVSTTSITMTATTATDDNGVEYYFTCTVGGGNDSGWQDSATYVDTGLTPSTEYTYTVTVRDKSANQNETTASSAESATTTSPTINWTGSGSVNWTGGGSIVWQ